ncbi:MAG: hypothetical protein AAGI01_10370 [Myxococcota bacterium]
MNTALFEKTLGILAGAEGGERVEVVQVAEPGATPTVEFRMQHASESMGWCTHKRIKLAPGQFKALRDALNLMDPDARDAELQVAPEREVRHLRLIG